MLSDARARGGLGDLGKVGLHTWELAQIRTPPMGAKRIPTMKNSGKTLLGVRIGLDRGQHIQGFLQEGYPG